MLDGSAATELDAAKVTLAPPAGAGADKVTVAVERWPLTRLAGASEIEARAATAGLTVNITVRVEPE